MKCIFCGKGGCGKSSISTLLANELAARGKKVLVIDTDESNFGLYRQLGMEAPKDLVDYFGGKVTAKANMNQNKPFFDHEWTMDDIPAEYVSEKPGVKLIATGKIHASGEGCACAEGAVARQFLENLKLRENEFAITDTEAGVEHFARKLDQFVDVVFMVVDPSYESIQLSEKIEGMSASINKPIYFVLNKVTEANEAFMVSSIKNPQKIAAVLPQKSALAFDGMTGVPYGPEVPEIGKIADLLMA